VCVLGETISAPEVTFDCAVGDFMRIRDCKSASSQIASAGPKTKDFVQALPIKTPLKKTSAPPNTTCTTLIQKLIWKYLLRTNAMAMSSIPTTM
jgi:hypothetical protein